MFCASALVSLFWGYKEHPCTKSPDFGLWRRLDFTDWGFASLYWFWLWYTRSTNFQLSFIVGWFTYWSFAILDISNLRENIFLKYFERPLTKFFNSLLVCLILLVGLLLQFWMLNLPEIFEFFLECLYTRSWIILNFVLICQSCLLSSRWCLSGCFGDISRIPPDSFWLALNFLYVNSSGPASLLKLA